MGRAEMRQAGSTNILPRNTLSEMRMRYFPRTPGFYFIICYRKKKIECITLSSVCLYLSDLFLPSLRNLGTMQNRRVPVGRQSASPA